MIRNRSIGGPTHSGSHIVSLELGNPEDLAVGSLVGLEGHTLVLADERHPIIGVLVHTGAQHVSLGVSGIFNAMGDGEVGQYVVGTRGLILASFVGLDSYGQTCDAVQILL